MQVRARQADGRCRRQVRGYKIAGPKLFAPPPPRQGKTLFVPPPPPPLSMGIPILWIKLRAPVTSKLFVPSLLSFSHLPPLPVLICQLIMAPQ